MKPGSPTKTLKVADIITPTKLVINGGADDGVEWGDRFLIYVYGSMVKDPDTGEDLERVLLRKGTGRVIAAQKKIATIESDTSVPSSNPFAITLGEIPKSVPFDEPTIGDLAFFMKPPESTKK